MGARWYTPAKAGFNNADTVSVDPVPVVEQRRDHSYAANGTLASEVTPTGTVASTTDAYGQQVTTGPESFSSDALGRTVSISGSAPMGPAVDLLVTSTVQASGTI